MGLGLDAECNCGFKENIWVDRGKIVKKPQCLAPALCKDCNRLISINYADKKDICPQCKGKNFIFYNDPSLQKDNHAPKDITWGMDIKKKFILPKTTFKCPKCGNMSLTFTHVENWD